MKVFSHVRVSNLLLLLYLCSTKASNETEIIVTDCSKEINNGEPCALDRTCINGQCLFCKEGLFFNSTTRDCSNCTAFDDGTTCGIERICKDGNCSCIEGLYENAQYRCTDDPCEAVTSPCDKGYTCVTTEDKFALCYCDPNSYMKEESGQCVEDACAKKACNESSEKCVNGTCECLLPFSVKVNDICIQACPNCDPNTSDCKLDKCVCKTDFKNISNVCVKDLCNTDQINCNGDRGQCVMIAEGSYICNCSHQYSGSKCLCSNQCLTSRCPQDATCVTTCQSRICLCNDTTKVFNEQTGLCEELDPCIFVSCDNPLEECSNGRCQCKAEFSYDNKCNPCKECKGDNVDCIYQGEEYKCTCKPGYQEYNINNKLHCFNSCQHANCEQTCHISTGTCECVDGFTLNHDNSTCTPTNKCSIPCNRNAQCIIVNGTEFTCVCKLFGYKLTRDSTCVDIDECKLGLYNCNLLEKCENTDGSYKCVCDDKISEGLDATGRCKDLDECNNFYKCPENSYCINQIGGYKCECNYGYRELDRTCQKNCNKEKIAMCEMENKKCNEEVFCFLTDSSCQCKQCKPTYFENDMKQCVKAQTSLHVELTVSWKYNRNQKTIGYYDVKKFETEFSEQIMKILNFKEKEAVQIVAIHEENTIIELELLSLSGDLNVSEINTLLQGNIFQPDENKPIGILGKFPIRNPKSVTVITDRCDSYEAKEKCDILSSKCQSTENGHSYTCICFSGFRKLDFYKCQDIDECKEDTHDCDQRSQCRNTFGGFECDCIEGFMKHDNECKKICEEINPCKNNGKCEKSTSNDQGYTCSCREGTEGSRCEKLNSFIKGLEGAIAVLSGVIVTFLITGSVYVCRMNAKLKHEKLKTKEAES